MIADNIKNYSFTYFGVMDDAMKSLPLGNGDVGANEYRTVYEATEKLVNTKDATLPNTILTEKYETKYRHFTKLYPILKDFFNL